MIIFILLQRMCQKKATADISFRFFFILQASIMLTFIGDMCRGGNRK